MIINLPTMRIKATLHANNFECFTYKMAEKTAGIDKKENVTVILCIPARRRLPVQKRGGQIFGHRVNGRCLRASDVAATTHIAQIVR